MTIQEYNTKVWPFYIRLEKDFLNTLDYVEFSEDNFGTYSIEFEKQLLSIGSEVDVLCKLLCKKIEPQKSPKEIKEYASILYQYKNLTCATVVFERNKKSYVPFEKWRPGCNPKWWGAYNAVKHKRLVKNKYKQGNLENVFMALAGLYVLNRYYCKIISSNRIMDEPEIKSQIFSMSGWRKCVPIGNNLLMVFETNGNVNIEYEEM